MKMIVSKTPRALGENAAKMIAALLKERIAAQGEARIVVSTGASQLTTIEALLKEDVDWSKIEMFHLDEYCGLPESHPASFRKYLKERLICHAPFRAVHLVDGTPAQIPALTKALREKPIDIGLIGIGENAHIAFNDPPADFDTKEAYIIVNLNDTCKKQQVGEGWFATIDDVPKQAVSMTVHQIFSCKTIISCVPFAVKADAIANTLSGEISNLIPATILKTHPDFTIFADSDSFSKVDSKTVSCEIIMK